MLLYCVNYSPTDTKLRQAKVEENFVRWTIELRTPGTTRSPNIGNLRIRLGAVQLRELFPELFAEFFAVN